MVNSSPGHRLGNMLYPRAARRTRPVRRKTSRARFCWMCSRHWALAAILKADSGTLKADSGTAAPPSATVLLRDGNLAAGQGHRLEDLLEAELRLAVGFLFRSGLIEEASFRFGRRAVFRIHRRFQGPRSGFPQQHPQPGVKNSVGEVYNRRANICNPIWAVRLWQKLSKS